MAPLGKHPKARTGPIPDQLLIVPTRRLSTHSPPLSSNPPEWRQELQSTPSYQLISLVLSSSRPGHARRTPGFLHHHLKFPIVRPRFIMCSSPPHACVLNRVGGHFHPTTSFRGFPKSPSSRCSTSFVRVCLDSSGCRATARDNEAPHPCTYSCNNLRRDCPVGARGVAEIDGPRGPFSVHSGA